MSPVRAEGIGNKGGTNPAREDLGAPENGMGSRTPTGTPQNPNPNNSPRTGGGVRVVYISPLKALSYDIERNLRAPLRGIGASVSVGIRTGDTSQAERAAMARKPPEILITTPESLYLILGSRARAMLGTVETVIVDEIHAVASVKRGAHLALTLERLEQQVRSARGPTLPPCNVWASRQRRTRSRRLVAFWWGPRARCGSSMQVYASRWICASTCRSSR